LNTDKNPKIKGWRSAAGFPGTLRPVVHWCVASLLFTTVAADSYTQEVSAAQKADAPLVFTVGGGKKIRVVTVTNALNSPWSMSFLPGGKDMLVTEQPGRIRIIRDGVLDPRPIWELPYEPLNKYNGKETGDRLHMVAAHPQFAQNGLVYFSYVKWSERGHTIAVARGRFDGLHDVKDILVADAWEPVWGGNIGGGLLFGPDATLYITVGDRDPLFMTDNNSSRMKCQDLSNHVGKVLRIRDDGTAPPDNPFVNRPGAKPEIYAYGIRNGYGLSFNPKDGVLWQADIGPMGGDELNTILPGHNYGWPLVSLGRNYTGSLVSDQPWLRPGMDMPQMYWMPVISPSSLLFYTGDQFPDWKGSLFVGALSTKQLLRLNLARISRPESMLETMGGRVRDVQQSPDGYIYVATEARIVAVTMAGYDPGKNVGTILRIEPAK
jgi:aldose sugar dehydrogenase